MYKCRYRDLMRACGTGPSFIYTHYQLMKWNRLLAAKNCSVSK